MYKGNKVISNSILKLMMHDVSYTLYVHVIHVSVYSLSKVGGGICLLIFIWHHTIMNNSIRLLWEMSRLHACRQSFI